MGVPVQGLGWPELEAGIHHRRHHHLHQRHDQHRRLHDQRHCHDDVQEIFMLESTQPRG